MFMEMSRELHVFWDDYWKNTTLICFLAQDQKNLLHCLELDMKRLSRVRRTNVSDSPKGRSFLSIFATLP